MTKPNLGKRHTCKSCETRFFDLNKNPAVCPKCGEGIRIAKPETERPVVAAAETEVETPSTDTTTGEAASDAVDAADAPEDSEDSDLEALEGSDEVDDLEAELEDDQGDDDLMEDTSDMGEDNDDMSEVLEHVDDGVADK